MGWRIGVDIGGTFTDVAVLDEASGRAGIAKVSTTTHDFGAAVIEGTRAAMDEYRIAPDLVTLISHATTIVTNALLESKGANVALVATRGFRDVLELRRSARADLYDLFQDAPSVLVPRRQRLEITERIDAQGAVVIPLDDAELDALVASIRGLDGVEAVAVCLMFSFLNDSHEQRIGERLRAALPDLPIFLSSEILPEIREYERTSTTAVCAYVGPVLTSYLERLEAALGELDLPALHVMGSNGGVLDVASALRMPAAAVESGPAAGVIAAQRLGDQIGRANLISFDMGGTTAKASLIENGRIETTSEYEVGGQGNVGRWLHGTGHPIRVPVIDLAEVSAGGGSIAWLDPGGALRVGPASAGAEPGPACYGRGGDRPTVTDANVVLGHLSRTHLLGGRLPIDAAAATEAVRAQVAGPLGQGVLEAAAGIVSVVNHGMAEALRIVSVERGHDAREFSLVAFGGAGPVHAAALAEELDIPEVIVPPIPGGFSALGLVTTDLRRDWSHTFYSPIELIDLDGLNRRLEELEREAEAMLRGAGIPEPGRAIERAADCRYTKQAYELTVPLAGGTITRDTLDALARAFHGQHLRTYGHENPNESVQMVNVRVTATGRMQRVGFHARPEAESAPAEAEREVWFGEPVRCPVIGRHDLPAAHSGTGPSVAAGTGANAGESAPAGRPGPLIVEEMDCTVVVPPGWIAALDERGFILMTRSGRTGDAEGGNGTGQKTTGAIEMSETKASPDPAGTSGGNGRTGGNGATRPAGTRTDAATFEVVKNSLYAVAEEMKVVLAKTAYSPILKVAGDYSCGVFDAEGNMVAQGPDLPIHLGSMPDAVRAVVRAWDDIDPGDVFIHNDPYFGGSHLPDVNVVSPAFVDGALLGFCCVRAHWPDVGSATPGSYGSVTDVYGEGLRLPPVRIHRAGSVNRDVEDIIFTNVRTPDERRGDLRAQIAANRRACDRLATLARKHGTEKLRRIMQEVMDYSEAMMRGLLREIPDGEGSFEDFCDGDGIFTHGANQDETFDIRLRVVKRGDTLTVDFAGSDPQVPGPMNAPLSVTASGVFTALKMAIDSAGVVPPNSGAWRPVEVLAPEATVVNARFPAPVVYANHEISHRVCDMVFGALAAIIPDRVMACSQGTSAVLTLGGVDYRTEEHYVSYETVKGGFGARPDRDGINAIASGISNTMNTPVEVIEMSFPVRVEEYGLLPDSGGAGRWRGGLGARRTWRILARDSRATVCCERTKSPPFGIAGGAAGAPARISIVEPNGAERILNSKGSFDAPAGSLVVFDVPGSGGYGPVAERDPARIREDLADGYVTPNGARRDYGVSDPEALLEDGNEEAPGTPG